MKKLSSALLAAGIVAGSAVALAAPAHAGSDKVEICHATSAANGHYNLIEVDKNAVVKQGHDQHQDGRDIIPAFSYVEDGVRLYFDGKNLDKLDILANGCVVPPAGPEPVTAEINPPTYIPASCARPDYPFGTVVVPEADGEGVVGHIGPTLNPEATEWTVEYILAADTAETDWSWPAMENGKFAFDVVPLTADPNYVIDSKTGVGACELANTGTTVEDLLPYAAGAVGLGALLFGAMKLRRRSA